MDLIYCLLLTIALLLGVVIYQSRREKPNLKLYSARLRRLILIFFNYFRDIGFYAAQRFREINWDLTIVNPLPDLP